MIQNELEYLNEKNEALEFEKDALLAITGGSVILLIVMVIVGLLFMRKRKAAR